MIQLDENKLGKLKTTNQSLDEKYGKHGTATRAYSGAYPFTFRGCNSPSIKV